MFTFSTFLQIAIVLQLLIFAIQCWPLTLLVGIILLADYIGWGGIALGALAIVLILGFIAVKLDS